MQPYQPIPSTSTKTPPSYTPTTQSSTPTKEIVLQPCLLVPHQLYQLYTQMLANSYLKSFLEEKAKDKDVPHSIFVSLLYFEQFKKTRFNKPPLQQQQQAHTFHSYQAPPQPTIVAPPQQQQPQPPQPSMKHSIQQNQNISTQHQAMQQQMQQISQQLQQLPTFPTAQQTTKPRTRQPPMPSQNGILPHQHQMYQQRSIAPVPSNPAPATTHAQHPHPRHQASAFAPPQRAVLNHPLQQYQHLPQQQMPPRAHQQLPPNYPNNGTDSPSEIIDLNAEE